jgi:hypothetical protein
MGSVTSPPRAKPPFPPAGARLATNLLRRVKTQSSPWRRAAAVLGQQDWGLEKRSKVGASALHVLMKTATVPHYNQLTGRVEQGAYGPPPQYLQAAVLPAWDGSKTALAGSKSSFGRRQFGDLVLYRLLSYPKPALAEPRPVPQKASSTALVPLVSDLRPGTTELMERCSETVSETKEPKKRYGGNSERINHVSGCNLGKGLLALGRSTDYVRCSIGLGSAGVPAHAPLHAARQAPQPLRRGGVAPGAAVADVAGRGGGAGHAAPALHAHAGQAAAMAPLQRRRLPHAQLGGDAWRVQPPGSVRAPAGGAAPLGEPRRAARRRTLRHEKGAGLKQLCCRPGTAVKLLWPAVNPALAEENSAI